MKKETSQRFYFILILLLSFILLANLVSATSNTCIPTITLVNQDPYPAVPGEYVEIVFQVSGVQDSNCNGMKFELMDSYPFSLYEGESIKILEGNTWISDYKNDWVIPYKLRVDKDAFDEESEIQVRYSLKSWVDTSVIQKFNISIEDSRTSFDAVIQESTGSEVSIAIANTGKYAANSVVVRIPEQENYEVSGTDGQMVGNLESGDYTIVGFTISQKIIRNMTGGFSNTPSNNPPQYSQDNSQKPKLQVDIYYTDNIGERRIVNMDLPLILANTNSTQMAGFPGFNRNTTKSSWYSSWILLVIILAFAGGAYLLYRKYPQQTKQKLQKLKSYFSKNSKKIDVPHWIKKPEKEKNK